MSWLPRRASRTTVLAAAAFAIFCFFLAGWAYDLGRETFFTTTCREAGGIPLPTTDGNFYCVFPFHLPDDPADESGHKMNYLKP
jgi:hypothetical protein